jgi:hypothetical protein
VPLGTVATMQGEAPLVLARESQFPGHHRLRSGAGRVAGPCGQPIEQREGDRPACASVTTDFSGAAGPSSRRCRMRGAGAGRHRGGLYRAGRAL